jgi:Glutathione S-transferase, N-terminal domain
LIVHRLQNKIRYCNGLCSNHCSCKHPASQDYPPLVMFQYSSCPFALTYTSYCRLEVSRSHRILWLLEELQIPYELKTYKRTKEKLADPALRAIHPLGKSPALTIEVPGSTQPLVLAKSAAIAEYLCDCYGKGLIPK